jgi:peptidoglycan/LPS O-acetylase OafA/YrhL
MAAGTGLADERYDNRFDVLRLLAAWLVLFSHCYPLAGRNAEEPLLQAIGVTLGAVGVTLFFAVSGYLVTQSLQRSPSLWVFAKRRALRIYPALVCVTLFATLALGPLLTALPQADYWTHERTWKYLWNATAWRVSYLLPQVFADNPFPAAVNGSLWTLPYEVRCYLALALLGVLPGRLSVKLALVTIALIAAGAARDVLPTLGSSDKLWGLDHYHVRLGLTFAIGGLYASLSSRIGPSLGACIALAAVALVLPGGAWREMTATAAFCTGILWLALHGRWLPRIPASMGDWSYGVYLYAFPVQQCLAWAGLHATSFVAYVLASTAITFALAGASWHLVEKQALRLR